jgi:hypothetical protein
VKWAGWSEVSDYFSSMAKVGGAYLVSKGRMHLGRLGAVGGIADKVQVANTANHCRVGHLYFICNLGIQVMQLVWRLRPSVCTVGYAMSLYGGVCGVQDGAACCGNC